MALSCSVYLNEGHDFTHPHHDTVKYLQFASLLKQYGNANQLSQGRLLHDELRLHGHDHNTFVGNCLVEMYGSCGSVEEAQATFDNITSPNTHSWNILMNVYAENNFIEDAQTVFDRMLNPNIYSWNTILKAYSKHGNLHRAHDVFRDMPARDVVSWTAMLTALSKHGHSRESLQLFHEMQAQGVEPNKVTFVCALDACADQEDLIEGQSIHSTIVGTHYASNVEVGNALVDMYGKCKGLDDATIVLSKMHHRDIVTYNAMLGALVDNEKCEEALNLFSQLQHEGVCTDEITYLCGLNACASIGALEVGKQLHSRIVCTGCDQDVVVGSALVNMYGKCGSVCPALSVFGTIHEKDVVSWNAIISALFQNGQGPEALELFSQMHCEGFKPNKTSVVCALNACASLGIVAEGHALHALILEMGYAEHLMVGNALVDMYGKCNCAADAQFTFNQMHGHDVISWNALIAAFAQNSMGRQALEVLHCMQCEGVKGDNITFVSSLSACAIAEDLQTGQEIHAAIDNTDYIKDTLVGNALVQMYGKCGCTAKARAIFDRIPHKDVTSWNVLLSVLSGHGNVEEVLSLFHLMEGEDIEPDVITFMCTLDACVRMNALEDGRYIHRAVVASGQEQNSVLENTLISLYVNCGAVDEAHDAFSKMRHYNVISWNMIIGALSQRGYSEEVFDYYNRMQGEKIAADVITYTCLLTSCAQKTALEKGCSIYAKIIDEGFIQDVMVGNALVSMYGKCGCIEDASIIFNRMWSRDIISWNAILAAFAQNGHGKEALNIFGQMQVEDFKPNEVTFVCVLMACTHIGQVDRGRYYFVSMERDYGITQTHAHIGYMIDLLGRAGLLDEAEELIDGMPMKEAKAAWLRLLGACRTHDDLGRAIRAASVCFEIDMTHAGPYILLSNIYASAGQQKDADGFLHVGSSLELMSVKNETLPEVRQVRHAPVLDDLLNLQVRNLNEELQRSTRESALGLGNNSLL